MPQFRTSENVQPFIHGRNISDTKRPIRLTLRDPMVKGCQEVQGLTCEDSHQQTVSGNYSIPSQFSAFSPTMEFSDVRFPVHVSGPNPAVTTYPTVRAATNNSSHQGIGASDLNVSNGHATGIKEDVTPATMMRHRIGHGMDNISSDSVRRSANRPSTSNSLSTCACVPYDSGYVKDSVR